MISDCKKNISLTNPHKLRAELIGVSHNHKMSILETQILKEKLAALYESMQNILFHKSEHAVSLYYLSHVVAQAKKTENILEETEAKLLELDKDKEGLKNHISELTHIKKNLYEEHDKMISRNREKLLRMKEMIDLGIEEKEKYKGDLEASEYNLRTISEEHEKLRQRVKIAKFRQPESESEKVCKNCKKFYHDNENFNWSCKIHSSQYSGEMWWCCGKSGEMAPGCKICMHECKEDDERETMGNVNKNSKLLCSVIIT